MHPFFRLLANRFGQRSKPSGEGPKTTSAIRRLFIQLLNNLRKPGNAAMRQKSAFRRLFGIWFFGISKYIKENAFEPLKGPRLDLKRGNERIFGVHGDAVRLSFQFKPDGKLH